VRRSSAVLLLALFIWSLISPALSAAEPDSKLPSCCRRAGKHHCAMIGSASDPPLAPVLQASRCPSFPTVNVVPLNRFGSLSAVSQASFAAPVTHPTLRQQAQSLYRVSFSRAVQKRGPPVLN
jgi:hypothetical protein